MTKRNGKLNLTQKQKAFRKALKAAPFIGLTLVSGLAVAAEKESSKGVWQAGLALATVDAAYKGRNRDNYVFPVLGYESERLYFRGIELGYRLLSSRSQELAIVSGIGGKRFDPKKNNNAELQQLDKRDFRLETGLKFTQRTPYGRFTAESRVNVRDFDTGYQSTLGYFYSFSPSPRQWQLGPRLDVSYVSGSYTDYFYGISQAEAGRSGLSAYDSNSSWNVAISLEGFVRLNERWSLAGTIKRSFLDDAIRNSPMTEGSHANSAFIIINYRL
ncbi:hypothetical protein CWE15_03030 [Aliidiomarina taiwanensis]|uniref:MipA/OmpV family protein n=1 Tax=Aliidiomarina taiwanensis TaxID=946228 RepID=A0A432XA06_9GAMM|nr:hypothetical protein CWE15_03030 [Aliidiomarina taiwanensis]